MRLLGSSLGRCFWPQSGRLEGGWPADYPKDAEIFSDLPKGYRIYWHLNALQFECINGGLSQYLYNWGSRTARFVARLLDDIGAAQAATALRAAAEMTDEWERCDKALGQLSDRLKALDPSWDELEDATLETICGWLVESVDLFLPVPLVPSSRPG